MTNRRVQRVAAGAAALVMTVGACGTGLVEPGATPPVSDRVTAAAEVARFQQVVSGDLVRRQARLAEIEELRASLLVEGHLLRHLAEQQRIAEIQGIRAAQTVEEWERRTGDGGPSSPSGWHDLPAVIAAFK